NKRKLNINEFTRSAYGIHYYTGMVIIEKKIMNAPFDVQRGNLTVGYIEYTAQKKYTLFQKLKGKLKKVFR
ncbi:MAG TPA: hypothetical protein PLA68_04740, partial [Panacibacter sp.]|nr:hypothetical protein [Panacibacter sp.]